MTTTQQHGGPLYRTWQRAAALVFQPRCLLCGCSLQKAKTYSPREPLQNTLCTRCLRAADCAPRPRCLRCALPLGPKPQSFDWTHCRHCKNRTDLGERHTVVCADYAEPFDDWVAMLKYGKQWQVGTLFGHWLASALQASCFPKPDLLLPVPCATSKLKARGYNQAAVICKSLGKAMGTPVQHHWLLKVNQSSAQASLNKEERAANLTGAFRANRPIDGRLLIGLVDDVITTGATIDECERVLRKAGARQIVVLAACRTPEY